MANIDSTPEGPLQASDLRFCVELRGVLSNPAVQDALSHTALSTETLEVDTLQATAPRPSIRRWRIVDRLGAHLIDELVRDSSAGVKQKVLATRYGISVSSVKRLLADYAH